jgi:biotin-dependent carboxylase-like uncharacterized protein
VIEVLAAGPLTTVQDAGRFGWRSLGVPVAGPADWLSHVVANRLVGNPDGAAALEVTLSGPRLRFSAPATVAVVGAAATLDGEAVPAGSPCRVPAGGTLAVGRTAPGIRGYLAVAGGLDMPAVLGSRSTDTLAGLGPARLSAGDRIDLPSDLLAPTAGDLLDLPAGDRPGGPAERPVRTIRLGALPAPGSELRVVPGPHEGWFTAESVRRLYGSAYTVTPASDRVGIRLAGPGLERARGGELPVTGMVPGALQVPPDGRPILLLANHGPTGGYPVVAVVATADLPSAGQARPGHDLRFRPVSRDEAVAAYARLRATLDGALPPARA